MQSERIKTIQQTYVLNTVHALIQCFPQNPVYFITSYVKKQK